MSEILLGRAVDYDARYDPHLLCPIPRAGGRAELGIVGAPPFHGWDIWNAYELSWLDAGGKPQVAIGEFRIQASSPNIVESKSFKLYLNSLNQQRFATVADVRVALQRDLAACVGADPVVRLYLPDDWDSFSPSQPQGECLDDIALSVDRYTPAPELLTADAGQVVTRRCFSRLLRSRCPVTGQPDWGAVMIEYTGPAIDPVGLLAYIISFRQHQDFHEHCVERMFVDIAARCRPARLSVYARYLRRGGLDINPYRCSAEQEPPNQRLFQQ
jgi:7-cyano-7-deazaguanine reductase